MLDMVDARSDLLTPRFGGMGVVDWVGCWDDVVVVVVDWDDIILEDGCLALELLRIVVDDGDVLLLLLLFGNCVLLSNVFVDIVALL